MRKTGAAAGPRGRRAWLWHSLVGTGTFPLDSAAEPWRFGEYECGFYGVNYGVVRGKDIGEKCISDGTVRG